MNVAEMRASLDRRREKVSVAATMSYFVFSWFLLGPPSMR